LGQRNNRQQRQSRARRYYPLCRGHVPGHAPALIFRNWRNCVRPGGGCGWCLMDFRSCDCGLYPTSHSHRGRGSTWGGSFSESIPNSSNKGRRWSR
jgi:hypothetical protein